MEQNKEKSKAKRLFVSGAQSTVGKSTLCMALLGSLLNSGIYTASDLAYIKPTTQCEDVQVVSKWCHKVGIEQRGIGPVVFYKGLTTDFVLGKVDDTTDQMIDRIKTAVEKIEIGKQLVLIDGIGYPSVGSVLGISNGDVAQALNAPVLIVGRCNGSFGDAVDNMNLNLTWFSTFKVSVVGIIFNKLPTSKIKDLEPVLRLYYEKKRMIQINVFGIIPVLEQQSQDEIKTERVSGDCRLRETETSLQFKSQEEEDSCDQFIEHFMHHVDWNSLLKFLNSK